MALFTFDIAGIFFGKGPLATLGAHVPQAGIGFMEAHGLAIIIAVLMWRAATAPTRDWHLAGAAVRPESEEESAAREREAVRCNSIAIAVSKRQRVFFSLRRYA